MSKLGKAMNVYYRDVQLVKVRKRVLKDAIRTITNVKVTVNRDNIFKTDESTKLFDELISSMYEIIS
jgi:hypothetical protein